MQRVSVVVRTGMRVVAALLLIQAVVLSEDGLNGDGRTLSRDLPGALQLEDLFDFSAAALSVDDVVVVEEDLLSGWTWGGYGQFSYVYNFSEPAPEDSHDGFKENVGRIFDTEHNDFDVDSVQLEVTKEPLDGSWFGMHVKAMAGEDAKYIHSAGLNEDDDFDLIAAQVDVFIPDDVAIVSGGQLTIGKFETIIGAEVISAPGNTMYSRSYLFGLAIPFTHTGLLYQQPIPISDDNPDLLGVKAGFVNGWDNVEDGNNAKSFLLGFTTSPCEWISVSVSGIVGDEQDSNESNTRGLIDVVVDITVPDMGESLEFLTGMNFLLNYDYGAEEGVPFDPDGIPANGDEFTKYSKWQGFSGIVKKQINGEWFVAFRGEVFTDPEGARAGVETRYFGLTQTVGYSPWENVLIRVEHRYDKANDKIFTNGGDLGDKNNMNTVSGDIVLTF